MERIAESIKTLAVLLDRLEPLPGNPRVGDVAAVMRSYTRFGQRKPIVAQRTGGSETAPTGVVIAGNHQLEAARRLGWRSIAVVWVDDDDNTARAFALADNKTSDLGSYDNGALAKMLLSIEDDPELLVATSYTPADVAKLVNGTDVELENPSVESTYLVIVECEGEHEQLSVLTEFVDRGFTIRALM